MANNSFLIKRVTDPVLEKDWHFHGEMELIYILSGDGLRLVGDNLDYYEPRELVLVGSNLPHLWSSTDKKSLIDQIVIKFNKAPGGIDIFSLPEFYLIRQLINKADSGISFGSKTRNKIHKLIIGLTEENEVRKWSSLINILDILSKSKDFTILSKPLAALSLSNLEENRLAKVITFITDNYSNSISLDEVSEIASMTKQSFCRFFKKRTSKTFIEFLNEYRLRKACFLLLNDELPIKEICFKLGFNSVINFNRMFKKHYGVAPSNYKKTYSADNTLPNFEKKMHPIMG